ncbi:hypothetical protein Tco_1030866 [Tanacetum coccineum]|uniref:Reverse transcriptase domain-containing protein n=1 Tax=Tanacetum coccineum TaxID=301880 RepID=A0ABQ5G8U9_9ASTR
MPTSRQMIDQGVTAALTARDANRNGDDSIFGNKRCQKDDALPENALYQGLHDSCQPQSSSPLNLRKKNDDKVTGPRNEIKKLEAELWNLKVKGTDVTGYNQRFQELALLCVRMFLEKSDKIEGYVGGLPDMIHGSVVASKTKNHAGSY